MEENPIYLARFVGGPLDGQTRMWPGSWPMPDTWDVVLVPEGSYVKTSQSQLTEDAPGIARGAVYEWTTEPSLRLVEPS
jgi:hypothetical protein